MRTHGNVYSQKQGRVAGTAGTCKEAERDLTGQGPPPGAAMDTRKGKHPPAYGMAPDTGQGGHNGHQGKPWKRPQPARK